MEEFTDFENLDLEKMSKEALESFCDRYIIQAMHTIQTGMIFPSDIEMCRLALAIVMGMYFKSLKEDIESDNRRIH
jgi:hypothetical protein